MVMDRSIVFLAVVIILVDCGRATEDTGRITGDPRLRQANVEGPNCEPLRIPWCLGAYQHIRLPNYLGHKTQEEAYYAMHRLWPLIRSGCSRDIGSYLCGMYAPRCPTPRSSSGSRGPEYSSPATSKPPCERECLRVRRECQKTMDEHGIVWPPELDCHRWRKHDGGEDCSNVEVRPTVMTTVGGGDSHHPQIEWEVETASTYRPTTTARSSWQTPQPKVLRASSTAATSTSSSSPPPSTFLATSSKNPSPTTTSRNQWRPIYQTDNITSKNRLESETTRAPAAVSVTSAAGAPGRDEGGVTTTTVGSEGTAIGRLNAYIKAMLNKTSSTADEGVTTQAPTIAGPPEATTTAGGIRRTTASTGGSPRTTEATTAMPKTTQTTTVKAPASARPVTAGALSSSSLTVEMISAFSTTPKVITDLPRSTTSTKTITDSSSTISTTQSRPSSAQTSTTTAAAVPDPTDSSVLGVQSLLEITPIIHEPKETDDDLSVNNGGEIPDIASPPEDTPAGRMRSSPTNDESSDELRLYPVYESSPSATCQSLSVPACRNLGYNATNIDPDMQNLAAIQIFYFSPLVQEVKCSDYLQSFLCAAYAPPCLPASGVSPPCRSFCQSARTDCEALIEKLGFRWPEELECDKYPSEKEASGKCVAELAYVEEDIGEGDEEYEPPQSLPVVSAGLITGPPVEDRRMSTTTTEKPAAPGVKTGLLEVTDPVRAAAVPPVVVEDEEDECEPLIEKRCRDLDAFNGSTRMPNVFGHNDQSEAAEIFAEYLPLIQCNPHSALFLCAVHFPPCHRRHSPAIVLPCRGLCETVRDGCLPTLKMFGFGWPSTLNCSRFPIGGGDTDECLGVPDGRQHISTKPPTPTVVTTVVSDTPTSGSTGDEEEKRRLSALSSLKATGALNPRCVALDSSSSSKWCRAFYEKTVFPNMLNHATLEEAELEMFQFWPLIENGCSSELAPLLCSIYTPQCTVLEYPLAPCRTTCERARRGCEPIMNSLGFRWPSHFNCTHFPSWEDGELCWRRDDGGKRSFLGGEGTEDSGGSLLGGPAAVGYATSSRAPSMSGSAAASSASTPAAVALSGSSTTNTTRPTVETAAEPPRAELRKKENAAMERNLSTIPRAKAPFRAGNGGDTEVSRCTGYVIVLSLSLLFSWR